MEKDQPERPDQAAEPPGAASDEPVSEDPQTALPPKMEAWRRRSAAGAILTGFALGLQEALDPHRDEPSIVIQTSGDPPDDLPVEAEFEYGRPRQSVVSIRPWLMPDRVSSEPAGGHPAAAGDRRSDDSRADTGRSDAGRPAESGRGGDRLYGGGPERPAGGS